VTVPASVTTNGTTSVVYVETIADPSGPLATEINAVSSLDVSCYLTGDGFAPETSENTVEDPRLCQAQTYEQRGDYTDAIELTYVFNPDSPSDNEAHTTLLEGTTGFIVVRWGVDSDAVFAAGDIVDVYPVTFGVQRKQAPTRNGVHRIMQKPFVTGQVYRDVVVA
jgi:hypothetical protein